MSRPLIGMTSYAERVGHSGKDVLVAMLPLDYVQAVHRSGGRAVLVTPDDPGLDVLASLDGIVFTGGSDMAASTYGAEEHPQTSPDTLRDRAEMMLMRAALDMDMPMLGICRGMQMMAVVEGGSLHQHLPDLLEHDEHRAGAGTDPLAAGDGAFGHHPVFTTPGSEASRILGPQLTVNSFHHQAVDDPGTLTPVGWCPDDGIIEILEDSSRDFALGVQWHPERTSDHRVFGAFVQAAERRCRRSSTTLTA